MKIELLQGLYEKYSKLALSFDSDRPIAIKGLERRLIRVLKTVGGYGIFDCYLHRCLLWQRSVDSASLKRIQSFRGEPIPSWSWMAYCGGIKYMDVPFGKISWSENITSPFKISPADRNGEEGTMPLEMHAQAWDIFEPQNHFILDEPGRTLTEPLKCVVIGVNAQMGQGPDQMYYTLIISEMRGAKAGVYERVGVGFLERQQIELDRPSTMVHIR